MQIILLSTQNKMYVISRRDRVRDVSIAGKYGNYTFIIISEYQALCNCAIKSLELI